VTDLVSAWHNQPIVNRLELPIILLVAGIGISLIGMVMVYKRGPRLGLPFSLSGIVLVIAAALVKVFSS
jgi:uncharacterized membrane protein YwaF